MVALGVADSDVMSNDSMCDVLVCGAEITVEVSCKLGATSLHDSIVGKC